MAVSYPKASLTPVRKKPRLRKQAGFFIAFDVGPSGDRVAAIAGKPRSHRTTSPLWERACPR